MIIITALALLQYAAYLIMSKSNNEGALTIFSNINGQNFPIVMLDGLSTIVVIYIVILLADIITDEYKNGTLKLVILRPVNRTKLMISKIAALLIGVFTLLMFTMVVSYIVGTIAFGWGESFKHAVVLINKAGEIETKNISFTTAVGILYTIKAYLITILPYMAFGMLVFFFSIIFTSMGATIGASLGVWFVFSLVGQLIKEARPFVINNYFNFHSQFAGTIDKLEVFKSLGVIAVYFALFSVAGIMLFRKKDILL